MAARIAWTRSGLVTCLRGTVRLGDTILAEAALDMCPRDDGSVLIVTPSEAAQLAPNGAEIERHAMPLHTAVVALATTSLQVIALDAADDYGVRHARIHTFDGALELRFECEQFAIPRDARLSVGISPSGRLARSATTPAAAVAGPSSTWSR